MKDRSHASCRRHGNGDGHPAGPRPGDRPGRRSRKAGAASGRSRSSTPRRSPPGSPPRPRTSDLADYIDDADRWEEYCRNTQFALAAARMADRPLGAETIDGPRPHPVRRLPRLRRGAAGLPPVRRPGQPDAARGQGRHVRVHPARGSRQLHPIREAEQEPGTPAGHLASLFGARGPNANCLTACAASSQAIGEAIEMIRRGDADVMLSGGTHSMIHPFGVTGFNLLTALSTRNDEPTRASRPFDRDRDGFILGEGAGMLVLEELEHAKARGRDDLRRDRRLRLDGRRLPHHRQPRRGPRRDRLHARGPGRRRAQPRGHRLHQRPRHQHRGQRLGRDAGHQADVRRRRPTRCRSPAPRA